MKNIRWPIHTHVGVTSFLDALLKIIALPGRVGLGRSVRLQRMTNSVRETYRSPMPSVFPALKLLARSKQMFLIQVY